MDHEKLIAEVKEEYARIASMESQQHFHNTTTEITAEAYYEKLLNKALDEICKGTFDNFSSGKEIVTAIANDKSWLTSK